MTCEIIGTGSTGNAILLNGNILLDCGLSFKQIEPYYRKLNLVLFGHVHGDHFNKTTIRRLAQERPLLRFGGGNWMICPLAGCRVSIDRIDSYAMNQTYHYKMLGGGDLCVTPFPLVHDVENCGYKIALPNGEKVLYAVDTGSMDGVEAVGYDLYMIEANHTEAEIQQRMQDKLERGEFSYESRAAATHLSKEKADAWLLENARENSKFVYLHKHHDRGGTRGAQ